MTARDNEAAVQQLLQEGRNEVKCSSLFSSVLIKFVTAYESD